MSNNHTNILIVEDESIASLYLKSILKDLGFNFIFESTNASEALDIVKENKIDLVFMDINIDGSIDGIQCSNILNKEYTLPIIFTTAYGDTNTIIEASNTNLYGYLIKPFESNDVEATLMITLKRSKNSIKELNQINTQTPSIINLGEGQKYNIINETFTINNIVIDLTKKELDVLHILSNNLNQNISYNTISDIVWEHKDISNSTIRDVVSRLKKKIPNLNIENIINFGYILKTEPGVVT